MNKLPQARSTDIVVQTLGKEILIYDLTTHRAFSLNETASLVYQACDGATTVERLKRESRLTDDLVFLALDRLRADNLLEPDASFVSPFEGVSRREAIRRAGLASMAALPVISALVAPAAADAQSLVNLTLGQTCTSSDQCSSSAPNCLNRSPGTGSRRCCAGSVSYFDAGGIVNSCSGDGCSSATFACQADAAIFCCSGSAAASCTGNICECRCD